MKPSISSDTKTKVTYGQLTLAVESLGYTPLKGKGYVVYEHPQTQAQPILPAGRPAERIDPTRLSGVYQLVAAGGLASREQFDAVLARTARPPRPAAAAK